jgi:hypothetical protein
MHWYTLFSFFGCRWRGTRSGSVGELSHLATRYLTVMRIVEVSCCWNASKVDTLELYVDESFSM